MKATQKNFLHIVPFTEETVYNSDRHVAIMLLFARSDAHTMEEVTFVLHMQLQNTKQFLLYNSLGRARVNNV